MKGLKKDLIIAKNGDLNKSNMKKLKIITHPDELESFVNRTDIDILNFDIKTVQQNSFAQYWFVAVVMYKELGK